MRVNVKQEEYLGENKARFIGHIDSPETQRDVWFEAPGPFDPEFQPSGAPWVLVALPIAARTGERIEIDRPVDPFFLENARGLVRTWSHWYPDLKDVEICAPIERASRAEGRRAQFFSGGVDSWFTLLRHVESTPRFPQVGEVDDLITVGGFDISLENGDEFAQLAAMAAEVAAYYGKRSVVVTTNLRQHIEGTWREMWGVRWAPLSHGAALAAVALVMANRYTSVKIASTHRFWEPFPYGSHPMTDSLFSTSATTFLHDHALYSRTDKIERIAESDFAMARLKVCYQEGGYQNCSRCVKCHRMLLCFDTLGLLNKAKSFDLDVYAHNRDRPFYIQTENDIVRALEVRDMALGHGRRDIVALVEESLRRSRRVRLVTEPLRNVSWRVWNRTFRHMAGDMIGA